MLQGVSTCLWANWLLNWRRLLTYNACDLFPQHHLSVIKNGSTEQICGHFSAFLDRGSILNMSGISLIQSVGGMTKKGLSDEELQATGGTSPSIQRDNSSFPSLTLSDSLLRVEIWHIAKQAHLPLALTTNPPPSPCQSALHTKNVWNEIWLVLCWSSSAGPAAAQSRHLW